MNHTDRDSSVGRVDPDVPARSDPITGGRDDSGMRRRPDLVKQRPQIGFGTRIFLQQVSKPGSPRRRQDSRRMPDVVSLSPGKLVPEPVKSTACKISPGCIAPAEKRGDSFTR